MRENAYSAGNPFEIAARAGHVCRQPDSLADHHQPLQYCRRRICRTADQPAANAILAAGIVTLVQLFAIGPVDGKVPIMPQSVLGGGTVMTFSSIVISGVQLVTTEPLNARSLSIVSVALGVGCGMGANTGILAHTPQAVQLIFGGSGIVPAALVAVLLNVVLTKEKEQ